MRLSKKELKKLIQEGVDKVLAQGGQEHPAEDPRIEDKKQLALEAIRNYIDLIKSNAGNIADDIANGVGTFPAITGDLIDDDEDDLTAVCHPSHPYPIDEVVEDLL